MTNLTKFILAAFIFPFAANINAQTQTAIVGESSLLKFNISNVTNTNKCHIEVTLPNQQKVGVEVDGPQFLASVEFTPQQIGNNVIQWEGKNKLRGLKSVFGCPGSGVIQVQVNSNTEQIAQKWNQYFSSVNEEIRDCVKVGMDLSQLKYQVFADPAVTLTSPQDLLLKPIYEKCESFAKQNQPRKGAPCTLASQNNLKTICDGVYAERQPDGRLKTISRTAAIQLQFEGKPWTVGVLENLDVRAARLKQEGDDKAKQAEELAAKKEADEKERLFKLSPEYKKQQAAIEIKRIADEKEAARKQAEQEKIRIADEKEVARKQVEQERIRIAEARQAATNNTKKELEEVGLSYIKILSSCAATYHVGGILFTGENKKIFLEGKEAALKINNKIIVNTFKNAYEVTEFSKKQYEDRVNYFLSASKKFTKADGTIGDGFFILFDKESKNCQNQTRLIVGG